MVGVPGRSKGCATCRRRKKGCDLKRPTCGQCLQRQVYCEGYEPDRVFVTSKYLASPPARLKDCQGATLDLVAFSASTYQVLLPTLARTAFRTQSVESVFKLFPSPHDARGSLLIKQLSQVLASSNAREEALRQTIFALGLVTLGKESNDEVILYKGRALYGRALRELNSTLLSSRAQIESLLITTRLMGLFEILYGADESACTQTQDWTSHAHGEVALIISRGAEAFTEGTAHALFTLARYSAVVIGIRSRKNIVFNEEAWKTIPWRGREKTASDTIVDILLELPEILEGLDNLNHIPPDDCCNKTRLAIAEKCWTVHRSLIAWAVVNSHLIYTPDTWKPIPIKFPNLYVASISSLDCVLRSPVQQFARLITRSMPWLLRKDNGALGPYTALFPLSTAIMYMQQSEIPDPDYMKLVFAAWSNPGLPSCIKMILARSNHKG
ncbi:hypothetical protein C7974DRAFT_465943 [Boeremia exigua]|uniref:uncharacterized protein n=1 Tax=Boeremia exigua TaxID=749465 RepID=UPI001E8EC0FA|nr:uncharacterized protein C7974DRAFT_465943 [Boeremia exigua]KAH6616849.1 hypothetical protein C7974DRAFT_465943 [Boeremia exigua]